MKTSQKWRSINIELNRIYNENCFNILKNINEESIDLILTDPPYGVNYQNNYTLHKHKKIKGDKNLSDIDYKLFVKEIFRVLKNNSHAYLFTRFDVYPYHYKCLMDAGFNIKNVLVIEKGHIGGVGDLKGSYANNSEWIIFCQKGRREFSKTKLIKNTKPKGKKCARQGNPIQEYKTRFNSCWFGESYPKSTYNASWQKKNDIYHPTIKNVKCLEWLIQISSNEGDIVLDPCAGVGSTLLGCIATNRNFIGVEIDKEYYDISKKRIDTYLK
ncbi:DNA-methyltransferase [Clostridium sporogenes]|uniref:DNA-methyltransferase n=1 Tax=Clostridium sporogenes TaxID=1509 RepID=UPI0013D4655A|nr:site-specific DNA-methyltransferase [Clostridium sporogenes]NFF75969.1 site-specific DNA-methyltransferase [Clostridium sporogenes]NFH40866.1 site-specific DNA-methyltransferase [Clostridium sporogenes]